MIGVYIHTAHGTTLTHPNKVVTTFSRDGTPLEKYVSELQPNDRTLFKGVKSDITFDEILTTLFEVEGYRTARDFVYRTDDSGYETTRLRHDIFRSLAERNPQFFKQEELDSLDKYIFRHIEDDGTTYDFDEKTVGNVVSYMLQELQPWGVNRSRGTYRNWLSGETIHPGDFVEAEILGDILENQELYERAYFINSLKGEDNPYLKLVTTHRVTAAILSNTNPMPDNYTPPETTAQNPENRQGRVFTNLPEWYMPVVHKLRPRLEEQVVETIVHKVELVEETGQGDEHAETGISRGVIILQDDESADKIYERLNITRPVSRRTTLIDLIGESSEIAAELLLSIKPHIQQAFQDIADSNLTSVDTLMIDLDTPYGRVRAPKQREYLRWISPLFGYSFDTIMRSTNQIVDRLNDALLRKDKQSFESWSNEVPKELLMREAMDRVYNQSMILRSLMTGQEFADSMTYSLRKNDVISYGGNLITMDQISMKQSSRRSLTRTASRNQKRTYRNFRRKIADDQQVAANLEELKRINEGIPIEIASLRSLDTLLARHGTMNNRTTSENIGSSVILLKIEYKVSPDKEIEIVEKISDAYDIDSEFLLRSIEEPLVRSFM